MSKRKHSEAVDSIQFKLVDVDEGDANGKLQQQQQRKEQLKTVGIYSSTNFGEKTRLNLNSDGTLPISADAVSSISIYGMQNWMDGIGDEAVQWLSKLAAEQQLKMSKERCKYCLNLFLSYEFKDDQESTFATNLATLLRVPGLLRLVGAFHYSEGGNLATFLARFPQLVAEPDFPRRYDVHVYCENDTLVEHYFADVKHWLVNLGKNVPAQKQTTAAEPMANLRQCRLKFVLDRADTAEEMLKLFKEDFDNAFDADGRRTFVVRLDCPGFSLDEFCYNNEKTGEVLAFAFKRSQVLKAEEDDDKMTDGEEEKSSEAEAAAPEGKRCRSTTTTTAPPPEGEANDDEAPKQDEDEEAESVVEWNTYHLIRCPSANREQMSAVEVPFLRNSLSIIH